MVIVFEFIEVFIVFDILFVLILNVIKKFKIVVIIIKIELYFCKSFISCFLCFCKY